VDNLKRFYQFSKDQKGKTMFSLKPKEGGSTGTKPTPQNSNLIIGGLIVCILLIAGVGYSGYDTRVALQERVTALENQLANEMKAVRNETGDLASDLDVVTKRVGVTATELDSARKFAERLRVEQERAKQELAQELATKAEATEVESQVLAVREEATTKLAEVQQIADTKIGSVSGEVKTVAASLDATRAELTESRREITDVRNNLSAQIARNATELGALRVKGERDFWEFDIKKGKKNVMQRVADIQLELRKTDVKKQRFDIVIGVDDSRLEKKERTANEPVQFLVGRDKLRYEVVVNFVDKDRIRGYVSAPKDKVLSAERPAFRPQ
jgi:chromosome segregation ATPase